MDMRHVKPAPGRKVREPRTRLHLPEAGKEVAWTPYWARRLNDGDIILVTPEAQAPAAETQKPSRRRNSGNSQDTVKA